MTRKKQPCLAIPLALYVFSAVINVSQGNICLDLTENVVMKNLYSGFTPIGRVDAGTYTKIGTAKSLPDCLSSCCDQDSCNIAFYHNDVCYLISCNASHPDLCDPQKRDGKKFDNTYLITVRTPDETKQLPEPKNNVVDDLGSDYTDLRQDCVPGREESCDVNQDCRLTITEEDVGYMCQCRDGYVLDLETQTCIEASLYTTSTLFDVDRPSNRDCTYGVHEDCFKHEECVVKNNRARHGMCRCEDGYVEEEDSGWCVPETIDTENAEEGDKTQDKGDTSEESTTLSTTEATTSTTMSTTTTTATTTTVTTAPSSSSSSTTTTKPAVETLVVSAGGNQEIQLPQNDVTVSASAVPSDKNGEYHYEWSLVSHPEGDDVGQMQDVNTADLKLSHLIAGLYTFKITVSAEGKYGETLVNVTVLPPTRKNTPPIAAINPPSQEVNQPNDVVLDGSESLDDDGITNYHWELVSGPLNGLHIEEGDLEKPILVLKEMTPGNYKFKLTVTDTDDVSNSTFANVTVIKETDYPPMANAGSNVIMSLPQNSITLNGNASTDDHGIASYEWIKKSDDKLTADMTGVRTPYLHLENLEVGDYTFTLKVTDTAGQTNTADVHVFVKPEHNKPPVANAGKTKVVLLPTSTTSLDGSNSTDDQGISTYAWTQVSGPTSPEIQNSDRAVATVSNLAKGQYIFRLTVTDIEGLQASDTAMITVRENENHPPEANAGGDKVVTLPLTLVTLDGRQSTDDKKVVLYHWTRTDRSLAAGDIINGSDHQAVLQLTNLVSGRYIFTLEVQDAEGLSSTDTASLIVKPDEMAEDLVEIYLDADLDTFTQAHKKNLQNHLALLLHKPGQEGEQEVVIEHLDNLANAKEVRVTFYVRTTIRDRQHVEKGTEVVKVLKKKLGGGTDVLDFDVLQIETMICQKNCSGHGHCDPHTKTCVCEAFWIENLIRTSVIGDGESNCDWSVLYVIIVVFIIVVTIAAFIWAFICLCRRWYRWRPKKRHRYTLLEEDDDDKDKLEMIPRGKLQNSSLMVSESDDSTDEETLFVNAKKSNGHVKNGYVKHGRSKVKT